MRRMLPSPPRRLGVLGGARAAGASVNPVGTRFPPDITGAEASAWRLIHANLSAVKDRAVSLTGVVAAGRRPFGRNLAAKQPGDGRWRYDSSDDDDGDWDDDDDEDDD